jgi:hypothetical protein
MDHQVTCSLCLAGCKAEEVAGALIHLVGNMSEDGKPELVVCADSPFKPQGRTVAPNGRLDRRP